MKENSFLPSMHKKSDQELQHIFDEKANYTDEAIEAVVLELDLRNLIDKSEVLKYKRVVQEKPTEILLKDATGSREQNADESPFEELVQPELYSKNAIQNFTIFFSTLFGTILLMHNLKVMNKSKARVQVLVFGISYIILSLLLLEVLPKMVFISLIFNILGYAILIEFFWNKHLGKEIIHTKKAISKPLIIALLITFFFIFLITLRTV
jgi:hypothetical protein